MYFCTLKIIIPHTVLSLFLNKKAFNTEDILKDRQKLIILGLMNDTVRFNKALNNFIDKYPPSKNNFVELYIKEFKNFDKDKYISSY